MILGLRSWCSTCYRAHKAAAGLLAMASPPLRALVVTIYDTTCLACCDRTSLLQIPVLKSEFMVSLTRGATELCCRPALGQIPAAPDGTRKTREPPLLPLWGEPELRLASPRTEGRRGLRPSRGRGAPLASRRVATRSPRGATVLGKGFKRGVVLSAGSFLVYEAYGLISRFAEVHASAKVEEVIEQADYLYGSGETEKLYHLLVQHKTSEDAELLWRLARASRDLAQLSSTSAEEKKQLVYEALEYAKKALERNESNFAAHKWYAICISDVGDYEGIKSKIANAFVIKEHFQRAIELNPKDATSIHLMGIWCYSFADMPWYQRKIAAVLFATPPTSTYKEVQCESVSEIICSCPSH
ncbi:PREDICTED: regulator of microtubule dynamics protein 1 [Tinamus guttatus]|uniref:regulator of microtubule dynamics protein 1 n=1 Tax=Tinamus guttatus TaxID=94827 RepID=UPI00052EA687|nr:PREDICTED: regulator of microtubule dynamics protein 1 [Tinamus guttatus]